MKSYSLYDHFETTEDGNFFRSLDGSDRFDPDPNSETCVQFPATRPVIDSRDKQKLVPTRFSMTQFTDVVKCASEATMDEIVYTWAGSLEYVLGITGACEASMACC